MILAELLTPANLEIRASGFLFFSLAFFLFYRGNCGVGVSGLGKLL